MALLRPLVFAAFAASAATTSPPPTQHAHHLGESGTAGGHGSARDPPPPPPGAVDPAVAAFHACKWRARVVEVINGSSLPRGAQISWAWGKGAAKAPRGEPEPSETNFVSSVGTEWSNDGVFNATYLQTFAKGYPDMYMLREKLPFITTGISVSAAVNATHPPDRKYPLGWKMEPLPVGNQSTGELWRVQIQATSSSWGKGADGMVTMEATLGAAAGKTTASDALLGATETGRAAPAPGSATLGVMVSLNRTQVQAPLQTYLQYVTTRYGPAFGAVAAVKTPPRKFPITDRLVGGGDSDPRTRAFLVQGMVDIGLSGLEGLSRAELRQYGMPYTGGGIYDPPGCEPATGVNASTLSAWANKTVSHALEEFAPQNLTNFALADEPGWYYEPETWSGPKSSGNPPPSLKPLWRAFLRQNNIKPSDLGAAGWDSIVQSDNRLATSLVGKRRFYWTARWSSWSAAQAFANASAALEAKLYPGIPLFVNFNNFAGRGYVPGPVGNNKAKNSTTAAMLSLDWMEFGRARGCTMLWTEDWFGDAKAQQWSLYSARLRSATRLAPAPTAAKPRPKYGGYIVPRSSGEEKDGILMKIISIIGGGGKALKYFIFGPEYTFPDNCYSETIASHPDIMASMAKAHGMIGKAEPLLYPAERVKSSVGVLYPRSSAYWDLRNVAVPTALMDCTNSNMDSGTMDYFAEVHGIYSALALQENIAVDFVDEDGMAEAATLAQFTTLFLTQPNIPTATVAPLVAWVKAGGTLVTTSNAAHWDEYDEPLAALQQALGIDEAPRNRTVFGTETFAYAHSGGAALQKNGSTADGSGHFEAWGATSAPNSSPTGKVTAHFSDGSPATVESTVGKGRVVHFYWLPGVSHSAGGGGGPETGKSANAVRDTIGEMLADTTRKSSSGGNQNLRHGAGGAVAAVDVSEKWVEAPLLVDEAGGAVVTLLNWRGKPLPQLQLNVSGLGFTPSKVESVLHGALTPTSDGEGLTVSVPLESADFLLLHK